MHKNIVFLAKVSPAQSLLPAPNGNETSFFKFNVPFEERNRSGLKFSGSPQTSLSLCTAKSPAMMTVSLGTWYPPKVVSHKVRCGTDDGTKVSNLNISLSVASV